MSNFQKLVNGIPTGNQVQGTDIDFNTVWKNYILYNNFEDNSTTGWSLGTVGTLTNGLPTGTPTFGSGASANLSIATTSSSIEGAYSLNYVSSAATTQGNMVATSSYAIDAEDQAKVLTVKFYYKAASGASNCNFSGTSSNSFAWAIYDVTNSSWLTSAGNFNLVQSSGCGYVTGTCQTNATTANIRLVVYNANATSGAATLTLDGFYVGPQTAPSGPAMTDWQSYTAIVTATSANPTYGTTQLNTNLWRRVGDSMEIAFQFEQSSNGTAGSGTYLFPLPSGYSIDTTKISVGSTGNFQSATCIVGQGEIYTDTTGPNDVSAPCQVTTWSTGELALWIDVVTTHGQTSVSSNYPAMFASGGFRDFSSSPLGIRFIAKVPIAGWSSNTSMSSDTDTRVVAGAAVGASASITSSYSNVTWLTINNDTHGAFTASSSATGYVIPVTGYYDFSGQIYVSATSITAGSNTTVSLYNGTSSTTLRETEYVYQGTQIISDGISFNYQQIYLTAGTLINIQIKSNTSSPVISASTTENFFSVGRRSGPAVVAATESVNASYNTLSSTTATAGTALKFTTLTKDSHNAYSTSTGLYTVPVSGFYMVTTVLGTVTSGFDTIYVSQNGATYSGAGRICDVGSSQGGSGSTCFQCKAGDTLAVVPNASFTWGNTGANFSVTRLGN